MTYSILKGMSLPAPKEIEAAVKGQRELATYLSTKLETQQISIKDADNKVHQIELPTSALTLLMAILGELAAGNAVQIVPVHAELTTQEAANILNVSRPHLVKLLEAGRLPFHKTGRHRRILFADLMQFKAQREEESLQAMQALADQSQELGLYWWSIPLFLLY
nr:helix-turn-helix domain-containing protein [Providencia rustigianii]